MLLDFSHNKNIQKGDVLLSEPFMSDSNFARTVVLICDDSEEEHVGFVINQQIKNFEIKNILEEIDDFSLFLGGPVEQNTLHFIHRCGDKISESIPIFDDVYMGGDFEQAVELLKLGAIEKSDIKFFLGYSGWGKEQLKSELNHGSWITTNISSRDVFTVEGKELWGKLVKKKGGKYKAVANYPMDPRLN